MDEATYGQGELDGDSYIDPLFLLAQRNVESGNNPNAVGPITPGGRALGDAQFMPATAKAMGIDPTDPEQSHWAQNQLLQQNLAKYGNMTDALHAYHGGTDQSQWGPLTQAYPDKVAAEYQKLLRQGGADQEQQGQLLPSAGIPPLIQTFRDRVAKARSLGYGDDQIIDSLKQIPEFAGTYQSALEKGYGDADIFSVYGLATKDPADALADLADAKKKAKAADTNPAAAAFPADSSWVVSRNTLSQGIADARKKGKSDTDIGSYLENSTDLGPGIRAARDAGATDQEIFQKLGLPGWKETPGFMSRAASRVGVGAHEELGNLAGLSLAQGAFTEQASKVIAQDFANQKAVSQDPDRAAYEASGAKTSADIESGINAGDYGKAAGAVVSKIGNVFTNPKQAALSAAQQAPGIATMIGEGMAGSAAGAAAGTAIPVVGTAAGAVVGGWAGMTAGQAPMSYGSFVKQKIGEEGARRGLDMTDPNNVMQVGSDSSFMDDVRNKALKFGLTDAAAQATVAAFGGKLFKGAMSTVADKPLATRIAAGVVGGAADTAAQATGFGVSGEAARAYASGTSFDPGKAAVGIANMAVPGAIFAAHGAMKGHGAPTQSEVDVGNDAKTPTQPPPQGPTEIPQAIRDAYDTAMNDILHAENGTPERADAEERLKRINKEVAKFSQQKAPAAEQPAAPAVEPTQAPPDGSSITLTPSDRKAATETPPQPPINIEPLPVKTGVDEPVAAPEPTIGMQGEGISHPAGRQEPPPLSTETQSEAPPLPPLEEVRTEQAASSRPVEPPAPMPTVSQDENGWKVDIGSTTYRVDGGKPFKSEAQANAFAEKRAEKEQSTPEPISQPEVSGSAESTGIASTPEPMPIKQFTDPKGKVVYSVPFDGAPKDRAALAKIAKAAGGAWRGSAEDDAIPGFHFKSADDAAAFAAGRGAPKAAESVTATAEASPVAASNAQITHELASQPFFKDYGRAQWAFHDTLQREATGKATPADVETAKHKLAEAGVIYDAALANWNKGASASSSALVAATPAAPERLASTHPKPNAPLAEGEHPGLVIKSLQTGKVMTIQPKGTVPPKNRKVIGKNVNGQDVYEDANGVRSVVEDGRLRSIENVQITPHGPVDKSRRGDEFKTTDEVNASGKEGLDPVADSKAMSEGRLPVIDDRERERQETIAKMAKREEEKKQEAMAAEPKATYGADNKFFTADAAEKARAVLRAKLSQASAGFDPEIAHAGLMLAGYHIEAGARAFGDFATKMVGELGNGVRPYLRQFYESVRHTPDFDMAKDMTPPHEITDDLVAHAGEEAHNEGRETSNEQVRPGSSGLGKPGTSEAGPRAGLMSQGEGRAGGVEAQPPADVLAPEQAGDTEQAGDGAGGEGIRSGKDVLPERNEPIGRSGSGGRRVAASRRGRNEPEPQPSRPNHFISDPDALIGGTPKVRFRRNMDAIKAYKSIEEEGRDPTPEEMNSMSAYTGWGSFGQELFNGSWERSRPKMGWEQEDSWLRQHLGADEWKSAQSSIINAHYTDPPTVQSIWGALKQMGFKGGRILEPSMGIGNFFGLMPRDIMGKSDLTGIEMDSLSGGMAKVLYPEANIQIKGYQDSKTPDGFYDLVVGNWPFAAQSPADRRYDKLSPTLHDYFFLKALDQTRPGGLVVGITSNGTMDKAGRAVRLEMAKKADLVAAYRLPSGAFDKYAGTSVVADMLVFRKRADTNMDAVNAPWIDTVDMMTDVGRQIRVNKYWQDNPDSVLGHMSWGHGTTSGRPGMIVNRRPDFAENLASLPDRLPTGVYTEFKRGNEPRFISNNSSDRENSVTVGKDGNLYQVQGERQVRVNDLEPMLKVKDKAAVADRTKQLSKLVGMRRAYGDLIDADRDGLPDADAKRKVLRDAYEAYRTAHGPISDSDGLKILKRMNDPAYASMAALERPDGSPSRILTEATVRGKVTLENPTVSDAYVLARNESTTLNMTRVAELAKKSEDEAASDLLSRGAVYRIPGGGYEASDIYLGGNVRRKLAEAMDAKERGEDMDGSIAALKAVVPPDKPYFLISANLGASWVNEPHYRQFVSDLLKLSPEDQNNIALRNTGGQWKVKFDAGWLNHKPEAETVWGSTEYPFDKLLSAAMNNRAIKITKPDGEGGRYTDDAATAEVNEKVQRLRDEFSDWAWRDVERRVDLERAFNDTMNAVARQKFDGSFMDMSGMALTRGKQDDPLSLRQHQMDAIWRGVVTGRGLYAHEVGTGKTMTAAGIAIESRRYGVAKKPFIFAHNANSKAVAREIQDMYPGAKVLYVDNLRPEEMATTIRRIANDDWDAVVFPHSVMDRIGMKRETLERMAAAEIANFENAAMEAASDDGAKITVDQMDSDDWKKIRSPTAKELVKARNAIKANIEKMANRASKEGAIAFEDLGCDMIMVDESHEFKKPPIATKMRMKGLNLATSARSIQLKLLTDYVKELRGGTGVHLFSGTPITNTLTELFHSMRYVMDDRMEKDGIKDWDSWFNTFAGSTNDIELSASGQYEPVTRLAKFDNVDELVRMAGEFTDSVAAKDMPEFKPRRTDAGKTLDSPDLTAADRAHLVDGRTESPEGRPYKKTVSDVGAMSQEQLAIRDHLRRLADEFKNASGKTRWDWMQTGDEHSPVLIETNAANAGIDARIYNPGAKEDPNSKLNRAMANIMRHYHESPLATQAVFIERGYQPLKPKDYSGPGYGAVSDLIDKLVKAGIPRKEIGIMAGGITAEKKSEMAAKMNAGELRVVIGQTATMGTGVNMQDNLRAMHHLDAPWTPGELEQRNGRGWRQGNKWNTVYEHRYLTEGIDGRRWQVLSVKDRFIRQIWDAFRNNDGKLIGSIEGDAADMSDEGGLSETLADAAGDPRIMIRHKHEADIKSLEKKERQYTFGLADARVRARNLAPQIERGKADLARYTQDAALAEAVRAAPSRWSATILGKKTEPTAASFQAALDSAVKGIKRGLPRQSIGTVDGFRLDTSWDNLRNEEPSYWLVGPSGEDYAVKPSSAGIASRLASMAKQTDNYRKHLSDQSASLESLNEAAQQSFPHKAKLAKKRQQLEELIADLQNNPEPPPAWLRHGAPIGTDVHINGEKRLVTGHSVGDDYQLTTEDGPVNYLDAKDENGERIYEPRPKPEGRDSTSGESLNQGSGTSTPGTARDTTADFRARSNDIAPGEPQHNAAAAHVILEGARTGNEHVALFDARTGKVVSTGTSDLEGRVDWTPELKAAIANPDNELIIHHNHPGNLALSPMDIEALGNPGIRWIVSHSPDGNMAAAKLSAQAIKFFNGKATEEVVSSIRKTVGRIWETVHKSLLAQEWTRQISRDDRAEYADDVVARVLREIGLIDYVSSRPIPERIEHVLNLTFVQSTLGVSNVRFVRPASDLSADRAMGTIFNDAQGRAGPERSWSSGGDTTDRRADGVEQNRGNAREDKKLKANDASRNVSDSEGKEIDARFVRPSSDLSTDRAMGKILSIAQDGERTERLATTGGNRDNLKDNGLAQGRPSSSDRPTAKAANQSRVVHGAWTVSADKAARRVFADASERAGRYDAESGNQSGSKKYDDKKAHREGEVVPRPDSAGEIIESPRSRQEEFEKAVKSGRENMRTIGESLQMWAAPMERGSDASRAIVKDFANAQRLAQYNAIEWDKEIKRDFTPQDHEAMWNAADKTSVDAQILMDSTGATRAEAIARIKAMGHGIYALPEAQRTLLERINAQAESLWARAKDVGLAKGDGLPFWTPRTAVLLGEDGTFGRFESQGEGAPSLDTIGANLRSTSKNLKHRKYLTAEETEAAMKKIDPKAQLVRNIREMPIAMLRLEHAIAGRELINSIRKLGKSTGAETVLDSERPGFFTIDHPALKTYRPKFEEVEVPADKMERLGYAVHDGHVVRPDPNDPTQGKILRSYRIGEDGKIWQSEAALDADGNPIMEKTHIYIRSDFEGPLRSVLSTKAGPVYNGLMKVKTAATLAIMYSPMIHLGVEIGRTFPTMPGKVLTGRVFRDGKAVLADQDAMREFIGGGMVPIGRGWAQDIHGVMNEPAIEAQRSWLGAKFAAAGTFWHQTMLWDQIAKLQAGIAVNIRDNMLAKGFSRQAATTEAAHIANRYAGALPLESMGETARRLANVMMFSRSYTLGNMGVMKDALNGGPSDMLSVLKRDVGSTEAERVRLYNKRLARAAFIFDIGLLYASNAILQGVSDKMIGDKSLSEIGQGYVNRFRNLIHEVAENPMDLINPFYLSGIPSKLLPGAEHEPGRENRIDLGPDSRGTHIYLRNPVGKVGEDFANWLTSPLATARSKLSTIARPVMDIASNNDSFGRQIYDRDADGAKGFLSNTGKVVSHLMEAQIPLPSIEAARDILTDAMAGRGPRPMDVMKVAGPFAGVTFSKGYPGGPAAGEVAAINRRAAHDRAEAMPEVKMLVEHGKEDEARVKLQSLGILPANATRIIKGYQNPQSRLTQKKVNAAMKKATPEEAARLQFLRGQQ